MQAVVVSEFGGPGQLRLTDAAGIADFRDHLAALDRVAAFDSHRLEMRVGRNQAVRMLDQHEIAVAADLVAGIGDGAAFDRAYRGATGRCDIDAGVLKRWSCSTMCSGDAIISGCCRRTSIQGPASCGATSRRPTARSD